MNSPVTKLNIDNIDDDGSNTIVNIVPPPQVKGQKPKEPITLTVNKEIPTRSKKSSAKHGQPPSPLKERSLISINQKHFKKDLLSNSKDGLYKYMSSKNQKSEGNLQIDLFENSHKKIFDGSLSYSNRQDKDHTILTINNKCYSNSQIRLSTDESQSERCQSHMKRAHAGWTIQS